MTLFRNNLAHIAQLNRPASEITLPMPGESWGAGTVIASCWENDDEAYGDLTYTLLVLDPQPPYYTLIAFNATRYSTLGSANFPNIIPAAEAYSEAIGGY